jgi:hypothetical protein
MDNIYESIKLITMTPTIIIQLISLSLISFFLIFALIRKYTN